jgi:hypothetical protein
MAVPAKRIPESVAHLDVEVVAAALVRHDANVRNAARALGVLSGDLRKLVLVDQRLADAALEAVELRLDDAEANLCVALHCDDPRRRDAVSMFMLRNTQRAAKRGYAVAASAASLEVNIGTEPRNYRVVWSKPDEPEREVVAGEFVRDGRILSAPDYSGEPRDDVDDDDRHDADDIVEGHLVQRSPMIEHEVPEPIEASEPAPPVVEPAPPAPESPAARYARERVAAWIRARLPSYPMDRCCYCRLPFNVGQQWREAANDVVRVRFHAACYAEWRTEREAAARQALGRLSTLLQSLTSSTESNMSRFCPDLVAIRASTIRRQRAGCCGCSRSTARSMRAACTTRR